MGAGENTKEKAVLQPWSVFDQTVILDARGNDVIDLTNCLNVYEDEKEELQRLALIAALIVHAVNRLPLLEEVAAAARALLNVQDNSFAAVDRLEAALAKLDAEPRG